MMCTATNSKNGSSSIVVMKNNNNTQRHNGGNSIRTTKLFNKKSQHRRHYNMAFVGLFLVSAKLSFDFALHHRQQLRMDYYSYDDSDNGLQAPWSQHQRGGRSSSHNNPQDNDFWNSYASDLIKDNNNFGNPLSPYAYAYVIGGCNPNLPVYRGFLYNILVSAKLLRQELGSTQDIIVFIQLSFVYTDSETLPEQDVEALTSLNIKILYIPPSQYESFYDTVLNKFLILSLTPYRRVLLMDGDVMPVSNLDYLFELSDNNKFGQSSSTLLKENVVVAGPYEPANAGFFMLKPGIGEYEHIQQIIKTREEKVRHKDMGKMKFDINEGWGHVIEVGDEWKSRKGTGRLWDFHFAFSDQGLLYYWTKYVKKSVSIIYKEHVENWSTDNNGRIRLERTLHQPFEKYESQVLVHQPSSCKKFMCGYMHFSGTTKPWMQEPRSDVTDGTKLLNRENLWWHTLIKLNDELQLNLNITNWEVMKRPSLGLHAAPRHINMHIRKGGGPVSEADDGDDSVQLGSNWTIKKIGNRKKRDGPPRVFDNNNDTHVRNNHTTEVAADDV